MKLLSLGDVGNRNQRVVKIELPYIWTQPAPGQDCQGFFNIVAASAVIETHFVDGGDGVDNVTSVED